MDSSASTPEPFIEEDHDALVDKMRHRLQVFFMDPLEKCRVKKRIPYKFVIQLLKIFLVTAQVCIFAYNRHSHANYTWSNKITFSHLFLKDWDPTREIDAYPPAMGPMAIYETDNFFSTIDYAFAKFLNLSSAIGQYSYVSGNDTGPEMELCLFQRGGNSADNIFDSKVVESCYNMTQSEEAEFSSKSALEEVEIHFARLVKAVLKFSLKTINYQTDGQILPPNCYRFDIEIIFDNEDLDGQILLSLETRPVQMTCEDDVKSLTYDIVILVLRSVLNYVIIIMCFFSLVLCSRSLWRAHQLRITTETFFLKNFERLLSTSDKCKFLNWWYIMIIINDILIMIGCFIKDQIEHKAFKSEEWNMCSIFLGMGNMLVWFGVLRYLGFFKSYNIVILTLGKAAPEIAKFLLCALLIFFGFTFSGWLILGPYHLKFQSLATTAECLFSLINGDDMFATFSIMSTESRFLWVFSKVYLYTFISLYIYIILSTFISVIDDAYDTIRKYYTEGFPKSELEQFIEGCNNYDVFKERKSTFKGCFGVLLKDLCCVCGKKQSNQLTESCNTLVLDD